MKLNLWNVVLLIVGSSLVIVCDWLVCGVFVLILVCEVWVLGLLIFVLLVVGSCLFIVYVML